MSTKTRAQVFIQPKNRRPLKTAGSIEYGTPAELRKRIEGYARTVWISAKRIDVDVLSEEILIDGNPVANYRLHIAGQPAPETPAVPVTARRRQRPANRRYMRHTAAQLAVTALGLALILTTGATIDAAWFAGAALAGYGVYRLALGVQRREAAHRAEPQRPAVEHVTMGELLRGAA